MEHADFPRGFFRDPGEIHSSIPQYAPVRRAFHSCSALESIRIPDSVTSIGREAFNSCTALKSIKIPKSITVIESFVFRECTSLRYLEIPE